jgi:hypothetical protein
MFVSPWKNLILSQGVIDLESKTMQGTPAVQQTQKQLKFPKRKNTKFKNSSPKGGRPPKYPLLEKRIQVTVKIPILHGMRLVDENNPIGEQIEVALALAFALRSAGIRLPELLSLFKKEGNAQTWEIPKPDGYKTAEKTMTIDHWT